MVFMKIIGQRGSGITKLHDFQLQDDEIKRTALQHTAGWYEKRFWARSHPYGRPQPWQAGSSIEALEGKVIRYMGG